MGKKSEKITLNQDFAYSSDADLNAQISAFQHEYEAKNDGRVAMDARRPLGPGKVRVTFRLVPRR